jgi:hypothetical protein
MGIVIEIFSRNGTIHSLTGVLYGVRKIENTKYEKTVANTHLGRMFWKGMVRKLSTAHP